MHTIWVHKGAGRQRVIYLSILHTGYPARKVGLWAVFRSLAITREAAVTDEDSSGIRYVKFWVDEAPTSPTEERTSPLGDDLPSRVPPTHPFAPFPLLSARDGGRAPVSPERRERIHFSLASQEK